MGKDMPPPEDSDLRSTSGSIFVRPKAFGDGIYDILLARMMSLEIGPGDRLSVEKLAREFGVSPTPIREALGRLEAVGLVVRTHLVGYRAAPRLTTKQFEDLFHLRVLIEPDLARGAAINADEVLVASLQETLIGMEEAAIDGPAFDQFARHDSRFHSLIAASSGNELICDVLTRLNIHIHIFRAISDSAVAKHSVAEHRKIIAAIADHEPEAAAQAMRQHVESSRENLKNSFKAAET